MHLMIMSFLRLRLVRRLRAIRSKDVCCQNPFPISKMTAYKKTVTTNQGKGKVRVKVNSNEIRECKSIHTRLIRTREFNIQIILLTWQVLTYFCIGNISVFSVLLNTSVGGGIYSLPNFPSKDEIFPVKLSLQIIFLQEGISGD